MARDFDGAADYLEKSESTVTAYAWSASMWVKMNSLTTLQTPFGITDTATATQWWRLQHRGDQASPNKDFEFSTRSSSIAVATTSALPEVNDNNWHHIALVATSNVSRQIYLDGSAGTASTTDLTPTGIDTLAVGSSVISSGRTYADCEMAEVAVWNGYSLTAGDVAILAAGYSPRMVQLTNLLYYWDLINDGGATSNARDLISNGTLSQTSSPAITAHPRIIYPASPHYGFDIAAAGGGGGGGGDGTPGGLHLRMGLNVGL